MVDVMPQKSGTQVIVEWVDSPEDWKRIRDLRLESLASDPDNFYPGSAAFEAIAPEEFWTSSFETGRWCVARIGQEDVGLARLCRDELGSEDRYIEKVWVRKDHRCAGAATEMVQQLIAQAQPFGKVSLWVMGDNDVARRFYTQRFEFVPSGEPQPTPDGRKEERFSLDLPQP